MDRSIFFAQSNSISGPFFYRQGIISSKSGTSPQAFSRDVAAATVICTMRTDEATENHFQQATVTFHNPFDDPRFEKRSVVIVDRNTKLDRINDCTVRRKLQNNALPPRYTPDNERFSDQPGSGFSQSTSQNLPVSGDLALAEIEPPDESCTLQIEHNRSRCQNNSNYAKRQRDRDRQRFRYQNDPDFAEHERMRKRKRYQNDPDYAKQLRERQREYYRNNPDYAQRKRERSREYQRELRKDPAYLELKRVRARKLRKDSAFQEQQSVLRREEKK